MEVLTWLEGLEGYSHWLPSAFFLLPFKLYKKKKNPIDISKKLAYSIANKNKLKYNGFISNNYGHYFFFHYLDDSIDLSFKARDSELWWTLIDEICNKQKIINFPVHDSVFNLFYNNSELIYLTDKNNIPIELRSFLKKMQSDQALKAMVLASSTADDVAQNALKEGFEFSGDELLRFSGKKVGKVTVKKNDVPGEYNWL